MRFAPGLGQFWCLCESLHLGLAKEEEKRSKFLFSILMPFVNPSIWTYFDSQTWGFVSVLVYWITLTIPITFCEFWRTRHVSIQYWASFLMVACLLASNFFTREKKNCPLETSQNQSVIPLKVFKDMWISKQTSHKLGRKEEVGLLSSQANGGVHVTIASVRFSFCFFN